MNTTSTASPSAVLIVLFAARHRHGLLGLALAPGRRAWSRLDEWGLGGRSFGTWVTWFLLGGDLYTAYTFVAVPRRCARPARSPGSSRCRTRSCSTRSSSSSWPGCGRSATGTATSPPPTSCAAGSARGACRSRWPSPASSPRCRTSRSSSSASRRCSRSWASAAATASIAKDLPLFIAFALLAAYTYSGGPARAGGHRVRQGHPDLPRHHRRDHLHPDEARRLGRHLRRGRGRRWRRPTRPTGKPNGVFIPGHGAVLGLRDAGARARRWRCSCTRTRSPRRLSAASRNTIRRNATILPAYSLRARPARAARLGGDRGRDQADRGQRQAERAAGHPAAVRGPVPGVVRGRGLRGDRHRRARAGGDHVDRGGEHLHPQHLQGVDQARRDAAAGGQGLQAGLAAGQGCSRWSSC